eukprot:10437186-Lingulodinium_polyedra.AAC.1
MRLRHWRSEAHGAALHELRAKDREACAHGDALDNGLRLVGFVVAARRPRAPAGALAAPEAQARLGQGPLQARPS